MADILTGEGFLRCREEARKAALQIVTDGGSYTESERALAWRFLKKWNVVIDEEEIDIG